MIILIRHLESTKNIKSSFSSLYDDEVLTEDSIKKGLILADSIFGYAHANNLCVNHIYCANSNRAISTASFIANKFNVDVNSYEELRSNNSGELLGKTELEAKRINPQFIHQLKLFRAGIFSSYDFVKVNEREDKHVFEQRVNLCINGILQDRSETLKVIVLHHSSLTAAVIRFARDFYGYPHDYYGHVSCELGNIYLINNNGIVLCNEPATSLISSEMENEIN